MKGNMEKIINEYELLSQEEKDKVENQIRKWEEEWRIADAHELQINLGHLRDLLDFNTYSIFRFQFEEKVTFSLEHIVGLIRAYKINNNI